MMLTKLGLQKPMTFSHTQVIRMHSGLAISHRDQPSKDSKGELSFLKNYLLKFY